MQEKQLHNQSKSICSSENRTLSFPWRKRSNVINLPPVCWLITSKNGALPGAQCWSLLLSHLAFSSSFSRVSLGEWESALLSPSIAPISAAIATLCAYWAMTGMAGERGRLCTEWVIFSTWLLNSPQLKSSFGEHLHGIQYLYILLLGEMCPHLSQLVSHQFSNHVLSKFMTIVESVHQFNPWTPEQPHIWVFLLPNKMYSHVYCPEFCSLWRFLFTAVFQGCPRKGL